MSSLPRKTKKALEKWQDGRPLSLREDRRLQGLFSRTRLSKKLRKPAGTEPSGYSL